MNEGTIALLVVSTISVVVWVLLLYEHRKHGPQDYSDYECTCHCHGEDDA